MHKALITSLIAPFTVCSAFLFAAPATAETQKIVAEDLQNKLYILNKVTAEQANYGIFNLTVPKNGSAVFVVNGSDEFSSSTGIPTQDRNIRNNAVHFNFRSEGKFSIAASTKCGVTVSAIVNVYADDKMPADIQPINKVTFEAPADCKNGK